MGKIKEFCKNHKKGLIVVGCLAGGAILGVLAVKYMHNKNYIDSLTDKAMITWKPEPDKLMGLERVKQILDLNAENASQFAIFREGPNLDAYACIALSNDVIL
jgi:type VI protein secretion system component VasK